MVVMAARMPMIIGAAKRDLEAMLEWGRKRMREGAFEAAVQHWTEALELKPGIMQALASRGYCYLTMGNLERALQDFAEVIAKDAGFHRNIYMLIALCHNRSGDNHTAIRYLSRCLTHFPNFDRALLVRGELYLKSRDFEKSRADFWQLLQLEPSHIVARRGLGDALRALGNFRDALKTYSRALEDAGEALERQHQRQEALFRAYQDGEGPDSLRDPDGQGNSTVFHVPPGSPRNNEDEAEEELDFGDVRLPEGPDKGDCSQELFEPEQLRGLISELLMRRALLLRLMGDVEKAGADLLEVIQLEPEHGLALLWYAKVLLEQHRHKEATPFLLAAIQHHEPTRAVSHALIGALLLTRPEPDLKGALRHLRQAEQLAPSSLPVRITLWICSAAHALRCSPRDPKKALSLLDNSLRALEEGSGSRSARGPRGHLAGSGGAAAAALSARSRSAEEARWTATRSLVRRQQELAEGDDLELALECKTYLHLVARDKLQSTTEVPPLLLLLRVEALWELGCLEEVVADCRRILALDPADDTTEYTMHVANGILRSRASKHEAAVGCFTKAIRLQPVSMEARLHRAIVLACAARALGAGSGGAGVHDHGRVTQLLTDAVQDLEAVDQQAQISDNPPPLGVAHLRAACLCSLGRPQEAWEVLCESSQQAPSGVGPDGREDPSIARQRALEAEVLVLLKRHSEAVQACTVVLEHNSTGLAEARVLRACCWSSIAQPERAFEDLAAARVLAPERADLLEASGDLYLTHSRLKEALIAYGEAMRFDPHPRLSYKRAQPLLALGQLGAALRELGRAHRPGPSLQLVQRVKDGVSALQTMAEGDFRHAHVRINMVLHHSTSSAPVLPVAESLPSQFAAHELVLYRAVCSLYLGDASTAVQDFAASLELRRQADVQDTQHNRTEEVASASDELFQCQCSYNMVLCYLSAGDCQAALASCERLLQHSEVLDSMGPEAQGAALFLAGTCHLALGNDELSKDFFLSSYHCHPKLVDDFLSRHEKMKERPQKVKLEQRRVGGCVLPVRLSKDAPPEVVCCLPPLSAGAERQEADGQPPTSDFSGLLSPLRLQVKDVVVWARPSVGWPHIRAPQLSPPTTLARLDLLKQLDGLPGVSRPVP